MLNARTASRIIADVLDVTPPTFDGLSPADRVRATDRAAAQGITPEELLARQHRRASAERASERRLDDMVARIRAARATR